MAEARARAPKELLATTRFLAHFLEKEVTSLWFCHTSASLLAREKGFRKSSLRSSANRGQSQLRRRCLFLVAARLRPLLSKLAQRRPLLLELALDTTALPARTLPAFLLL